MLFDSLRKFAIAALGLALFCSSPGGGCGQKTGHILLRLFHAKSVLNRTQST